MSVVAAPPPTVAVGPRSASSFHVCGVVGLVAAAALAAVLTARLALAPAAMLGGALAGVALLFGLTWITRVLAGEETISNYHHLVAVTGSAALVAVVARVPVVPHLAAFVVSLMVFQGFGRLGCLSVGCCHGRPAGWGVRYDATHPGVAPYLVGVPLLPVQLAEACGALLLAAAGARALLRGTPPLAALLGVIAGYAALRLLADLARGDPGRRRRAGLTEAQWTSLLLLAGAGAAAWRAGLLALLPLGLLAGATLLVAALPAIAARADWPSAALDADQVQEIAGALALVRRDAEWASHARPDATHVATTSAGLTLSACAGGRHYTLSRAPRALPARTALCLSRLVLQLRHPGGAGTLVAGRAPGTWHLLVSR